MYRAAFPDMHVDIEQMVAEQDVVVVRWTGRGTHLAPLQGIAPADAASSHGRGTGAGQLRLPITVGPTGRQVSFSGIAEFHIVNGRVSRLWLLLDELAVLTELGVLPQA